jgi:hypothetical protein
MELPDELQKYIKEYLNERWERAWKKVMKELLSVKVNVRIFAISNLMTKMWYLPKHKLIRTCLACGDYYTIPMYSSLRTNCECP